MSFRCIQNHVSTLGKCCTFEAQVVLDTKEDGLTAQGLPCQGGAMGHKSNPYKKSTSPALHVVLVRVCWCSLKTSDDGILLL